MTIFPTILPAAQPAAGAGWQAQSMQEKIATFDRKFGALHQARKEKIAQVNDRIRQEKNHDKRKAIIKTAIENDRIHPHDITNSGGHSCLVCEAAGKDDIPFVEFLLRNNADPNRKGTVWGMISAPALRFAPTVSMAQVLLTGGASLAKHGADALHHAVKKSSPEDDADNNLAQWYLDRGVDVNAYHNEATPLLTSIFHTFNPAKTELLLQHGALLSASIKAKGYHCVNGYNVPQIIKRKEETNGKNPSTETIKNILKKHSNYRHNGLRQDLALCKGSENNPLLAPLCALVVQYYVQAEPTYDELEKMPVPKNDTEDLIDSLI